MFVILVSVTFVSSDFESPHNGTDIQVQFLYIKNKNMSNKKLKTKKNVCFKHQK